MLLLHGTADNSVPCENAVAFSTLLKVRGCASPLPVYFPSPERVITRSST